MTNTIEAHRAALNLLGAIPGPSQVFVHWVAMPCYLVLAPALRIPESFRRVKSHNACASAGAASRGLFDVQRCCCWMRLRVKPFGFAPKCEVFGRAGAAAVESSGRRQVAAVPSHTAIV